MHGRQNPMRECLEETEQRGDGLGVATASGREATRPNPNARRKAKAQGHSATGAPTLEHVVFS